MGNFGFLKAEWPTLHEEARRAEEATYADPRTACFYARRCLELALTWLYDADGTLSQPYQRTLAAKITEPSLGKLVGPPIRTKMDIIRRQGNNAAHGRAAVAEKDSVAVLRELFHVMYWIARNYARNAADVPPAALVFDPDIIPHPVPESVQRKRLAELQALEEAHARRDAEAERARDTNEDLDAELAELRKQIKAAKARNKALPGTHDFNEAETRTNIIDLLLKEAGWALDDERDREFPVVGMPGPTGRGKVDYVLWDTNDKPLALVEAKRTSRDTYEGQQQAKLYADSLEKMFGQRPITFYTNGYQTHLWDDTNYPEREVQGFFTRDELRLMIQRRASRQAPTKLPINPQIVDRPYQLRAIRRVSEAFEQDKQRDALLVMATGAGKTRTVIGLIDLLSRANWVKRVLFLADRKALVTQATNAFKQHLSNMPTVNLLKSKDSNARIFVSTYPTMMGLIDQLDGDKRQFGPGYFDLVVVDEAHRSIYQKYGAIFDYFDSLLLGLTATPKDEIDRNTYRRFHLEDGVPTDWYSLDEAITDGFLVPPRTVDVPSKFQRQGIRYADLSAEDKELWDELEWDEDGNVPDSVNSEELNKYLFNDDSIDKALKTLMVHGLKIDGGNTLGKTIIFAKNQEHANVIAKRFNHNYPEYRGEFARVITHKVEQSDDLIDKFSAKDKLPQIAISVDMLDTGIDIPEVVNLVFFKLVRSKTKFWQMIGRGTRLCPDLFGPGMDKTHFLVFDLCQNVEFFNQQLARAEGSLQPSLNERLFVHRADLVLGLDQLADSKLGAAAIEDGAELRREVVQRLQQEVAGMNPDNFLVRPHREQVDTYSELKNWVKLTPQSHAEVTAHLASLPTKFRDDEDGVEAKHFDRLALRLQLAVLNGEPVFDSLRTRVQGMASELLDYTTIPAVAQQQLFLDELAGDEWWQDVTLKMLESMRRRIRGLAKHIVGTKRAIVYTDFEDEFGELAEVELQDVALGTNWTQFMTKSRVYLHKYHNHLTVQKLRRNKQITEADLDELGRLFVENGIGTADDLQRATQEAGGFGLFIRKIQGLDRDAVREAFAEFCAGKTFSANQLDFLAKIIEYLTVNGTIGIGRLYEAPFSSIAPGGPEAIFTHQEVDDLQSIFVDIRNTAVLPEAA